MSKISNAVVSQLQEVKIPNTVTKVTQLTSDVLFSKQENDLNVLEGLISCVEKNIDKETAEWVRYHKLLRNLSDVHSLTQRVVINRLLIQLILRYMAYLPLENPSFIIGAIKENGTHADWAKRLDDFIIPYFHTNSIFKLFMERDKELEAYLKNNNPS